jgi:hypothetical protein
MDPLDKAARWSKAASRSYYKWVGQMLSLSFAGLTALVALQGNYRPDNDLARWLLWCTFASLAASAVASAIVLRGEVQTLRALFHHYLEESTKQPPLTGKTRHVESPPCLAQFAGWLLPWVLSFSVLFLFAFSVTNSFPKEKPPKTDHQTSKADQ